MNDLRSIVGPLFSSFYAGTAELHFRNKNFKGDGKFSGGYFENLLRDE